MRQYPITEIIKTKSRSPIFPAERRVVRIMAALTPCSQVVKVVVGGVVIEMRYGEHDLAACYWMRVFVGCAAVWVDRRPFALVRGAIKNLAAYVLPLFRVDGAARVQLHVFAGNGHGHYIQCLVRFGKVRGHGVTYQLLYACLGPFPLILSISRSK